MALIAFGTVTVAGSPDAKSQALGPCQTRRSDVELSGDLGGPELASEHQARLNLASTRLRQSLSHTHLYALLDSTPAQNTIDEAKSRYLYLHDCNGCDLDIGRQLERFSYWWLGQSEKPDRTLLAHVRDSRRRYGSDPRTGVVRLQR